MTRAGRGRRLGDLAGPGAASSRIDLHSHTTASDGTLAPEALVALAVARGVRVLAVTDHDSTDGMAAAADAAGRSPGFVLVPGIELNCEAEGAEIHVLGYGFDIGAPWLQELLAARRSERADRVRSTCARLAAVGVVLDPGEVLALAGTGAPGRPHVARALVARGVVGSVREAFDRYLAHGRPAYVPRVGFAPADAVDVIRRAGGVAVLAHPGLARRDELIPGLVEAGLGGLEAWHPDHSAQQAAHYAAMAARLGLVATGGSDYHGPQPGARRGPGSQRVPAEAWAALEARLVGAARGAVGEVRRPARWPS